MKTSFLSASYVTDHGFTLPFDQPVISSGTPSPSKSKLCMAITWFFDWNNQVYILGNEKLITRPHWLHGVPSLQILA